MTTRPGRNDLCHCGSGKKYKRCHLDSDEAARTAAAASAAAAAAASAPPIDEDTKQADQQKASQQLSARQRKDLGRSITTSRRRSV
jgi:hypothetical protein